MGVGCSRPLATARFSSKSRSRRQLPKERGRCSLVLGAGFDTLCLRLAPRYPPQVQFFEVNHPATSAAKARGIVQQGKPPNMMQIAVDLGECPLGRALSQESHWETSVLSVVVAEGLFQYLGDEQVRGLFAEAATCTPPGSRFVFTHAIPGKRRILSVMLRFVGESWKSTVESPDLPTYVEGTGWSIISGVGTDAAHGAERYAGAERR